MKSRAERLRWMRRRHRTAESALLLARGECASAQALPSRSEKCLTPKHSPRSSPAPSAEARPRPATWRIMFADKVAREAVTYCPECAEREFGEPE